MGVRSPGLLCSVDRLAKELCDERTERRQLALALQNNSSDTEDLRRMLDTANEHLLLLSREFSSITNSSAFKAECHTEHAERLEQLTKELRGVHGTACRTFRRRSPG